MTYGRFSIRIAGTDLRSLTVNYSPRRDNIFDASGQMIGQLEYVGLRDDNGTRTYWGWRPLGSTWNRHQLTTLREAALHLKEKADA